MPPHWRPAIPQGRQRAGQRTSSRQLAVRRRRRGPCPVRVRARRHINQGQASARPERLDRPDRRSRPATRSFPRRGSGVDSQSVDRAKLLNGLRWVAEGRGREQLLSCGHPDDHSGGTESGCRLLQQPWQILGLVRRPMAVQTPRPLVIPVPRVERRRARLRDRQERLRWRDRHGLVRNDRRRHAHQKNRTDDPQDCDGGTNRP